MEIQKNTVTQKVWFTYNNSDLNPEDRHFATLTEYDTYYKGTLHIDYLTTGTQYFYRGYAGNAYGEDVEIVHNFFHASYSYYTISIEYKLYYCYF